VFAPFQHRAVTPNPSEVLASPATLPGLRLGRADQPAEREADHFARDVLSNKKPTELVRPVTSGSAINASLHGGGKVEAPPSVRDALSMPGRPLDAASRSYFEPRFGADFSHVRIHSDGRAAASAEDVRSNAYTVGQEMVFGANQYRPHTEDGRRLLAHELTHVVQQRGSGGPPGKAHEAEAEAAASAVANDAAPSVKLTSGIGIAAQRKGSDSSDTLTDQEVVQLETALAALIEPPQSARPFAKIKPEEIDKKIILLSYYRTQVTPLRFSMFVFSHSDDIEYWLGNLGFRGARFRVNDSGMHVGDLGQTVDDFDSSVQNHARVKAGQRVERAPNLPTSDQIEARQAQLETEELEDGRVYTGKHSDLQKERSFAVGNVVRQKIWRWLGRSCSGSSPCSFDSCATWCWARPGSSGAWAPSTSGPATRACAPSSTGSGWVI